jgi:hypothetical protein
LTRLVNDHSTSSGYVPTRRHCTHSRFPADSTAHRFALHAARAKAIAAQSFWLRVQTAPAGSPGLRPKINCSSDNCAGSVVRKATGRYAHIRWPGTAPRLTMRRRQRREVEGADRDSRLQNDCAMRMKVSFAAPHVRGSDGSVEEMTAAMPGQSQCALPAAFAVGRAMSNATIAARYLPLLPLSSLVSR